MSSFLCLANLVQAPASQVIYKARDCCYAVLLYATFLQYNFLHGL